MFQRVFHSRTAAALATWLTLGTVVLGLLAWLTPEWFGTLTVPQATLLGIGAISALSLVIAVAVFVFALGFRRLRPLEATATPVPDYAPPVAPAPDSVPPDNVAPAYDDSALRAEIAALSQSVHGVIENYERWSNNWGPQMAKIDRVAVAVETMITAARHEYADAICADLQDLRKGIKESPTPIDVHRGMPTHILGSIRPRLLQLGVREHEIAAAEKREHDRVMGDAALISERPRHLFLGQLRAYEMLAAQQKEGPRWDLTTALYEYDRTHQQIQPSP